MARRSCTFNRGLLTEISLDLLNLFTILCVVNGERSIQKVVSHDSFVLAKSSVDAPFIHKRDHLTYYQFTDCFKTV